jgi:hypothetical protein
MYSTCIRHVWGGGGGGYVISPNIAWGRKLDRCISCKRNFSFLAITLYICVLSFRLERLVSVLRKRITNSGNQTL